MTDKQAKSALIEDIKNREYGNAIERAKEAIAGNTKSSVMLFSVQNIDSFKEKAFSGVNYGVMIELSIEEVAKLKYYDRPANNQ